MEEEKEVEDDAEGRRSFIPTRFVSEVFISKVNDSKS